MANMGPIPDYGDQMEINDFAEAVHGCAFIDYDGSGCYATATQMSDERFSPSSFSIKPEYTHVVWFNR